MNTHDPIITVRDVAEHLQIHYETALRYVQAGRIRGVKRGKYWYIRASALEEFLTPVAPGHVA